MEKIKIPETYEEFLKTPINKAEDEYRKRKQITKSKKKTKTIWEDLYGE